MTRIDVMKQNINKLRGVSTGIVHNIMHLVPSTYINKHRMISMDQSLVKLFFLKNKEMFKITLISHLASSVTTCSKSIPSWLTVQDGLLQYVIYVLIGNFGMQFFIFLLYLKN